MFVRTLTNRERKRQPLATPEEDEQVGVKKMVRVPIRKIRPLKEDRNGTVESIDIKELKKGIKVFTTYLHILKCRLFLMNLQKIKDPYDFNEWVSLEENCKRVSTHKLKKQ